MLFGLFLLAILAVEGEGKVHCGGHTADDCKGCPSGHGASWCNGDCKWCKDGGCQLKSKACTVLGKWNAWSGYTPCSTTCGQGAKLRMRLCVNPSYSGKGQAKCEDSDHEIAQCNVKECAVDGGWSCWNAYHSCSKTCGTGEMKRTRLCNNPTPQNGGKKCSGESSETKTCNLKECGPRPSTRENPGTSCKTLKEKYGYKKSGMYWIKLGSPTEVFCDMETDGGGWTMIGQAVAKKESDKTEISYKKITSNDLSKLGQVTKNRFLLGTPGMNNLQKYISFTQIRFFCNKPWHGRTVDLATKQNNVGKKVVDLMLGKSSATVTGCNSYDRLPDDNSVIGRSCQLWNGRRWNKYVSAHMYHYPMYLNYKNHFTLDSAQCDDCGQGGCKMDPKYSSIGRWAFYVR